MRLYTGIDLHSSNSYLGIVDNKDRVVYKGKQKNDLGGILGVLEPYRKDIEGVVVESTFNWYWLVDGLMDEGYRVHLANPSAIKQYEGLKFVDDKRDALWLARMLRLGILPEGYIYPKEDRPIRDLLRKRGHLVRHRVSHILSVENLVARNQGKKISGNRVKQLKEEDAWEMFDEEYLSLAVESSIAVMRFLERRIRKIEKSVKEKIRVRKPFKSLLTIRGVGEILGLTIMLEVGNIGRFPKVGNFSSYCRCVRSSRESNGKQKGQGNRKNGNRYLAWAFVEAANLSIRHCSYAKAYYQRKSAKTNSIVAIKAISHKLARAAYYIMRDQVPYDPLRLFG